MLVAVADTHAIIWYAFSNPRLSVTARQTIQDAFANGDTIALATISLVEITYLVEKGRIPMHTMQAIMGIVHDPASGLQLVDLDESIALYLSQVSRDEVPDMPDRIIAATALRLSIPVISRDGKIQLSQVPTIW